MNIEKVDLLDNTSTSNNKSNVPYGNPVDVEYTDLEPAKVSNMTDAIKSIGTEIKATGNDVVSFAEKYKDIKYVYGSNNPSNGLDCSGFTQQVYKNFGVDLPHSSSDQRNYGTKIESINNAQPGDLLFFDGHVGIYMGDNKMIHASSGSGKVRIQENLDLYFHDMPLRAIRRIL